MNWTNNKKIIKLQKRTIWIFYLFYFIGINCDPNEDRKSDLNETSSVASMDSKEGNDMALKSEATETSRRRDTPVIVV